MAIDHPSLYWPGVKESNFELNSPGKAALTLFNALDRRSICTFLSTHRRGIPCTISPQFTFGSTHLFIELAFLDNEFYVARLNLWERDRRDKMLESEVEVMKLVRARTTKIPVPEVYDWNPTSGNIFGTPFIIMQAMNGQKLYLNEPVFEKFPTKILDQMASMMIELSTIQSDFIGDFETLRNLDESILIEKKDYFRSSRDFYDYYIDKYLPGFAPLSNDEKDRCRRLVRELERPGPFPLAVSPFGQNSKILIDENGNITGMLDWTHVGGYPWEMFAQFPQVIRVSWLNGKGYSPQKWQLKWYGQTYFVECLQKYERERNLPQTVSSFLGSEAKIVSEGLLSIANHGTLRTRWMKILGRIERRRRDPGYLPGSITYEDVWKWWRGLDRSVAFKCAICDTVGTTGTVCTGCVNGL